MKKIYLNTLTPEEIISRLKKGEVAKVNCGHKYLMKDGIIIKYDGDDFCLCPDLWNSYDTYFEEEEKFEVDTTGLYRTRDGRKAFVSIVFDDCCRGVIQGNEYTYVWDKDGSFANGGKAADLISKWEE